MTTTAAPRRQRPVSVLARHRAGRALAALVVPELEAGRRLEDVLEDPDVGAVLDEQPYLVEDLASHHVIARAIWAASEPFATDPEPLASEPEVRALALA